MRRQNGDNVIADHVGGGDGVTTVRESESGETEGEDRCESKS